MPYINILPDENQKYVPIHNNINRNKYTRYRKIRKIILILLLVLLMISSITITTIIVLIDKRKFATKIKNTYHNIKENYYQNDYLLKNDLVTVKGFVPLNDNEVNGPITLNKEMDDGTKLDLRSLMNIGFENDTIDDVYDSNMFNNLEEVLPENSKYLCELDENMPSEGLKGYVLSCPSQYTISVNYTFYGRYENDIENCNKYPGGQEVKENYLRNPTDCGYDPMHVVKDLCEGKQECTIKPCNDFFANYCHRKFKYLHIKYHCIRNKVSI